MSDNHPEQSTQTWERQIIEKMVFESIKEQRRSRRWRIFFRLFFLFILFLLLYMLFNGGAATIKSHTALVRVQGMIAENSRASANNIVRGLRNAFEDKNTKGIILSIDSPGGSPVQSNIVFEELIRLRKENPNTKVYAVCQDLCASGAYYIAAGANDIYADKASIVGSIGVTMEGFGLVNSLEKIGATRRVFTAGTNKDFMDPFLPLKAPDVEHVQGMLDIIHNQFIGAVKLGRGDRLQESSELYTGLVWTGEQAKALGLVDGFGTVDIIARDVIKEKNIVDYTVYGDIIQRFTENLSTKFSQQIGALFGVRQTRVSTQL